MASSDDELLNTAVPSSNVGSRQSEELVEPSGPDNCSLESESSLPRMNNEEGLSNLDEHLQSLEVRSRILACWKSFKSWLRPLVVVSVPLLLLPLPITLQNSVSQLPGTFGVPSVQQCRKLPKIFLYAHSNVYIRTYRIPLLMFVGVQGSLCHIDYSHLLDH